MWRRQVDSLFFKWKCLCPQSADKRLISLNFKTQIPWGRACQKALSFTNKALAKLGEVAGFPKWPMYQYYRVQTQLWPTLWREGPLFRQVSSSHCSHLPAEAKSEDWKEYSGRAVVKGTQTDGVSFKQGVGEGARTREAQGDGQHQVTEEGWAKSVQINFKLNLIKFKNHSSILCPIPLLLFKFLDYLKKESTLVFLSARVGWAVTLSFYVCPPPRRESSLSRAMVPGDIQIGDRQGLRN